MSEFPREPTREERDLLDCLIEANPEQAEDLRLLLTDAQVRAVCPGDCKCLWFTTNAAVFRERTWLYELPYAVEGHVDGEYVHAQLWVEPDGRADIEMFWGSPPKYRPGRYPRPDELRVVTV